MAIKNDDESKTLVSILAITQLSFVKFCMRCRKGAKAIGEDDERRCEETFCQLKQIVVGLSRPDRKRPLLKR